MRSDLASIDIPLDMSGALLIPSISFRPAVAPMWLRRAVAMLPLTMLAIVAGCGATIRPVIGPVEFTTSSGTAITPVSELAVNGEVYFYATVSDDNQFLGVSWTVTCGSAQPPSTGVIDTSCGTISPPQTMSGPIPVYGPAGIVTSFTAPPAIPKGAFVTITAQVTSMPSVSSSTSIKIVAAQNAMDAVRGPVVKPLQVRLLPTAQTPLSEEPGL